MSGLWVPYNYSNITGMYDLMTYANSITNNYFGAVLAMATWMIFFIIFHKGGMEDAFAASSFIAFTATMMLRGAGLIGDLFTILFMFMTSISIIVMFAKKEKTGG